MESIKILEIIASDPDLQKSFENFKNVGKQIIKDEEVLVEYALNRVIDENDRLRKKFDIPQNRLTFDALNHEVVVDYLLMYIEHKSNELLSQRLDRELIKMQRSVRELEPKLSSYFLQNANEDTIKAIYASKGLKMAIDLALFKVMNDEKYVDPKVDEAKSFIVDKINGSTNDQAIRNVDTIQNIDSLSLAIDDKLDEIKGETGVRQFINEEMEKHRNSPLQITRNRLDNVKNYVQEQREKEGEWIWLFKFQHVLAIFIILYITCALFKSNKDEIILIIKYLGIIILILFVSSKFGLTGELSFSLPLEFLAML